MPRAPAQDRAIASSFLKGLDLMTVLARRPEGMAVPALVARMKLPRTSILRMLHTLEIYGLVVRTDGIWRSTDRFRDWCNRDMYGEIRARYRRTLEAIAKAVGEVVVLAVGEGEGVRFIDWVRPAETVAIDTLKSSLYPLHITATGKLLLSQRPDLCARIKDRRLLQEIDAARKQGVAWNRRELDPNIVCCAFWAGHPSSVTPLICIRWPFVRFTEARAASALAAARRVLGAA
jgi:DNA-binding IclR family transcriptional regulator